MKHTFPDHLPGQSLRTYLWHNSWGSPNGLQIEFCFLSGLHPLQNLYKVNQERPWTHQANAQLLEPEFKINHTVTETRQSSGNFSRSCESKQCKNAAHMGIPPLGHPHRFAGIMDLLFPSREEDFWGVSAQCSDYKHTLEMEVLPKQVNCGSWCLWVQSYHLALSICWKIQSWSESGPEQGTCGRNTCARPLWDEKERLHTIVEVEEEAGHVFVIDLPSSISLVLRDELQR